VWWERERKGRRRVLSARASFERIASLSHKPRSKGFKRDCAPRPQAPGARATHMTMGSCPVSGVCKSPKTPTHAGAPRPQTRPSETGVRGPALAQQPHAQVMQAAQRRPSGAGSPGGERGRDDAVVADVHAGRSRSGDPQGPAALLQQTPHDPGSVSASVSPPDDGGAAVPAQVAQVAQHSDAEVACDRHITGRVHARRWSRRPPTLSTPRTTGGVPSGAVRSRDNEIDQLEAASI